MTIRQITEQDFNDWHQMALLLWPDHTDDEMREVLTLIDAAPNETAFIVRDDDQTAVGFMNLSLRTDYVPGATQKPVAYLEGIYVRDTYQHRGIGRQLIEYAQVWARRQGCVELASDVLIGNDESVAFHERIGFEEVERTISFIKRL